MKKMHLLLITILMMASCHPALADGKSEVGVGGTVHDHYKNIIVQQNPTQIQVCKNVNTSGDKSGDLVTGAIIGGIIGNQIEGVKDGGTLGAVLGAMLGHSNSDASAGTQRVCRYETHYNEVSKTVYDYSVVKFYYQGKEYRIKFRK